MTQTQAPARGRFDPESDVPYGRCSECREIFANEAEASAHISATMREVEPPPDGFGVIAIAHSIRVTNPTRERRVRSHVASVIDDAIVDAVNALLSLTGSGEASEAEISSALAGHPDFEEAWLDALAEDDDFDGAYTPLEVPRSQPVAQTTTPIDAEEKP